MRYMLYVLSDGQLSMTLHSTHTAYVRGCAAITWHDITLSFRCAVSCHRAGDGDDTEAPTRAGSEGPPEDTLGTEADDLALNRPVQPARRRAPQTLFSRSDWRALMRSWLSYRIDKGRAHARDITQLPW